MKEEFICKHDLDNPDHLICELKSSSAHRAVEIFLGVGFVMMLIVVGTILVKGRSVDKGRENGMATADLMLLTDRHPEERSERPALPAGRSLTNVSADPAMAGRDSSPPKADQNDSISQQYSGQSEIYLDSEALYFSREGEQVGRGPWPLKVGETTKLKIFWRLSPGDKAQNNAVVTAKLGRGVMWTGFVPIGNGIIYIPEEKSIQWRPGDQTALAFEVAITPTVDAISADYLLILDELTISFKANNSGASRKLVMPNTMILLSPDP